METENQLEESKRSVKDQNEQEKKKCKIPIPEEKEDNTHIVVGKEPPILGKSIWPD